MPQKARDIMTPNPACITPGETVQQAAEIMRRENVGSLPVVEDHNSKRIIGMITDRDIAIRVIGEGRDGQTRVEAAMTGNPICAKADQDVHDVALLMADNQVRRIPILDEQDRVAGIVAQADLALKATDEQTVEEVVEEVSQPSDQHSQG